MLNLNLSGENYLVYTFALLVTGNNEIKANEMGQALSIYLCQFADDKAGEG